MVATVEQVRRLTKERLQDRLQVETKARLAYYANHPDEIGQRLQELDEEWDIERAIELEAAGTVLTGVALGTFVNRKWFLLSALASSMLLLHNMQGWYPLLPLLRWMGFRAPHEIAQERYALKAMRKDFQAVGDGQGREQARVAFEAARPTGRMQRPAITPPM